MRILAALLVFYLGLCAGAAEDRIWMDTTINGQRARLIFDTGSSDSALFRGTVERLNLKLTNAPPGFKQPSGMSEVLFTEPLDIAFETLNGRIQFAVLDLPQFGKTAADGLLSWYPLRNQVFIFSAAAQTMHIDDTVPQEVLRWPKFKLRTDTPVLGFESGRADLQHYVIYVDTGAFDGVALQHSLWERWIATRTNQPTTMIGLAPLMTGILVKQETWAHEIAIGTFRLNEVPVRAMDIKEELPQARPSLAATLGLFALRRLDLVVDGKNGVVYAQPKEGPAPAYAHNQLGAVFPPRDSQSDDLIAHVAPGSPAYLAGLRDNDVLLKIDDLDVTKWRANPGIFKTRFWERPAGTKYKLTLRRGDREYQTTVVLKRILGSDVSAAQP